MGAHTAVLQYNDGVLAMSNVLDHFSLSCGYVTRYISIYDDRKSVENSRRKSSDTGKKRRRKLRSKFKDILDREKEAEPQETYLMDIRKIMCM